MNSHWTYLAVNLGAVLIPFVFSFHPKLQFYKQWKAAIVAIVSIGVLFIAWDVYYTSISVWGFNPDYLLGIDVFNLPLEEVLFFVCIPYACLFTYHCFQRLLNFKKVAFFDVSLKVLAAALLVLAVVFIDRLYSSVTFGLFGALLVYLIYVKKPSWLPRMFTSLLVLIIPFLIVNGILTGTGLEKEVVWYNPNELMGARVLTVPIEDFFYGALLIVLNVMVYEKLKLNKAAIN